MAIPSTDPQVLANEARCFGSCIPIGEQLAVQTYLLAVIAGLPTDSAGAQSLANAARCFASCIPPGDQLAVQNYILAQING